MWVNFTAWSRTQLKSSYDSEWMKTVLEKKVLKRGRNLLSVHTVSRCSALWEINRLVMWTCSPQPPVEKINVSYYQQKKIMFLFLCLKMYFISLELHPWRSILVYALSPFLCFSVSLCQTNHRLIIAVASCKNTANCTFYRSGGPIITPLHRLMGWFYLPEFS